VLETLRADPRTATIPVVVVSIVENHPVSVDVAANGYVAKPVDRARLLNLVRTLAQGGPTTQPVLVVEDNAQDRDILCTILAAEHFNVIPAAGGQEAIEWLRHNTPVLVVLDLMLPDTSGFDVLSLIRQQPMTTSVPVIVVSAKDLTADEHAFLATRLAALIRKDGLRPQDLLQRVRASLGK
jgi:CheY-like chemotaxis protein